MSNKVYQMQFIFAATGQVLCYSATFTEEQYQEYQDIAELCGKGKFTYLEIETYDGDKAYLNEDVLRQCMVLLKLIRGGGYDED